MAKKDYVTLNDEHEQVIEIKKGRCGQFFWSFRDDDGDILGPYVSRKAAIDDAQAFCDSPTCD